MQRHQIINSIFGILTIISGILVLFFPGLDLFYLGILLTISVLFSGISQLSIYFSLPKGFRNNGNLIWAILYCIISVLILCTASIGQFITLVPYLVSFLVITFGIYAMLLENKKAKVLGIISIILGSLMLAMPLFTGIIISYFIACFLIYQGFLQVVNAFKK